MCFGYSPSFTTTMTSSKKHYPWQKAGGRVVRVTIPNFTKWASSRRETVMVHLAKQPQRYSITTN
ncbi:hypothetical protein WG66_003945 [Moniliophthora roreri]|nr:hypothetical protein WG66_003945 [Moniliophthora roreri]